jgi:hypothetical protein
MLNYQTWLQSNVAKVLIVQVNVYSSGVETTRYLSTYPVIVNGIQYLPIVRNNIEITESISTAYSASISYGDIEVANSNEELSSWLSDVWVNRSCKIYVGSVPLPGTSLDLTNDFELVFNGLVEDIDSKSYGVLNLKIRDRLENVNYPVTEAILGNYFHGAVLADTDPAYTNQYINTIRPLIFGEVHNVTPLLTDPTQLEYMVSNGPVEQIIEVLDNGVPISFRTTKAGVEVGEVPPGSFRLNSSPVGTVTASVQGVAKTISISGATFSSSYLNTAANNIATLLKFYGKQLSYTDMDNTSFSTECQEAIGIAVTDRTNLLAVCQEIAKSCGCVLAVTRKGLIKLVKLAIPSVQVAEINDSNSFLGSLVLSERPAVIAGVKLGYARNYTVMTGLVTGIPEQHKSLLATEYLEALVTDTSVQALYGITTEPDIENTRLIDKTEATNVASTKLALFSTPRKVISVACTSELMSLEVGNGVTVKSSRLGIGSAPGLVISTKVNWLTGRIDLKVLI